jgi:hypothetical protein
MARLGCGPGLSCDQTLRRFQRHDKSAVIDVKNLMNNVIGLPRHIKVVLKCTTWWLVSIYSARKYGNS